MVGSLIQWKRGASGWRGCSAGRWTQYTSQSERLRVKCAPSGSSYQPPALPPPLVFEEWPEDDDDESLDPLSLDPHELVNELAWLASWCTA